MAAGVVALSACGTTSSSGGSTSPSGSSSSGGTSSSGTSSSGSGSTITIAMPSEPNSLDPSRASNGNLAFYQQLAYASLIDTDAKGALVPGLATKWGYVGTGAEKFQLTLRSGLEFADGQPLTAADAAASINYFVKNGTGPSSAAMAGLHASAPNATTVDVTSTRPNPVIPQLLTPENFGGNIIAPKGLADPKLLASQTFGAGPYTLSTSQTVPGDHYTYVANPDYYDKSQVHSKTIVLKVITNSASGVQALVSGEVDAFYGDATTVDTAQSAGDQIFKSPSFWNGLFLYDWDGVQAPALEKLQVRQALNYAVDRPAIAKAVYGQYGSATDQPNTPGFDGYSPALANAYPYDPAKAKQLLAAAGYPHGFTMHITYSSFDTLTTELDQAIASDLGKVGVKMQLVPAASNTALVTQLESKKYSGVDPAGWGGQNQFQQTSQCWLPDAQMNPYHNAVPGLQQAFDAYASASTNSVAAAHAVEKIIVDQALTLPVVQGDAMWFVSPKIHGFSIDPQAYPNNPSEWTLS